MAAKIVGARYFLLKNRDLVFKGFLDGVVFDDDIFGVTGIIIGTGEPAGVSIGFNRWGLAACNSTVLATSDTAYDILMEHVLRESRTVDEAHERVTEELRAGARFQWGNFLLATPKEVAAIEIGDGVSEFERDSVMIARANHHLRLPTNELLKRAKAEEREAAGPIHTSQKRRQLAAKMLESATSLGDMMKILSSHSESRGFDSICRHRPESRGESPFQGETSSSYIIEILKNDSSSFEFRIHVARGNPCSNTYSMVEVDFDATQERRREIAVSFS